MQPRSNNGILQVPRASDSSTRLLSPLQLRHRYHQKTHSMLRCRFPRSFGRRLGKLHPLKTFAFHKEVTRVGWVFFAGNACLLVRKLAMSLPRSKAQCETAFPKVPSHLLSIDITLTFQEHLDPTLPTLLERPPTPVTPPSKPKRLSSGPEFPSSEYAKRMSGVDIGSQSISAPVDMEIEEPDKEKKSKAAKQRKRRMLDEEYAFDGWSDINLLEDITLGGFAFAHSGCYSLSVLNRRRSTGRVLPPRVTVSERPFSCIFVSRRNTFLV